MNARLLLAISSVAALASCSTSYKAQTPDDVYFSPAKPAAEYVKTETKEQPKADPYRYDDYYSSQDRYLRWKVRDPQRWSTFDDYDYQWYAYNNMPGSYYTTVPSWGVYFNNYWSWNNYYNPYCHNVIVVNPKTNATVFNKIRTYTPGTYNNKTYNNTNGNRAVKLSTGAYSPNRYNNNNSSSFGSAVKKIFSNSGSSYNSNSSSSDRPSRTYTPSSSSSSSSGGGRSSGGSSGGGGGGVSRPSRGG